MTEHIKARAWRERLGLTRADLSKLTGYSPESIYWFELGRSPPIGGADGKPPAETAWRRYRNVCAGVALQIETNRTFRWE